MMLMPLWSTLVAVLLGLIVLGERVTPRVVIGGVAILGGLLLAVIAPSVRPAPHASSGGHRTK